MATFRSPPHNRWPFVMEGGEPVIDQDWFDFFRKISSLFSRGQNASIDLGGVSITFTHGVATAVTGTGFRRPIINCTDTDYYLTPEESGSFCVFGREAGCEFHLPTPEAGLEYEFFLYYSVAGDPFIVSIDTNPEKMIGGFIAASDGGPDGGISMIAIASQVIIDAPDTGGIRGTCFKVTAIDSSTWAVRGVSLGAGSQNTPFA